jgi:hypothetical protein
MADAWGALEGSSRCPYRAEPFDAYAGGEIEITESVPCLKALPGSG